jgi:hypothetical protein
VFNNKLSNPRAAQKPRKLNLAEGQVQMMLCTFLRHEATFRQVRLQLLPAHFPQSLNYLAAVWGVACDHWKNFDEQLPTPEILFTDVEQWLRHADLESRDIEDLDKFLNKVTTTPAEEIERQVGKARQCLKQFLEEALQRELQKQISSGEPVEMPALLESMTNRVQAISAVDIEGVSEPFPADLKDIPVIDKISTGCDFFDKYLNGGQADGEVYGLCAPYGVCKTLLAIQLAVERAKTEQAVWDQADDPSRPLPLVYVVFYEEEEPSFLARALSYCAVVDKTIIEEGRYDDMSTKEKGNYKPYERKLFAGQLAQGHAIDGERERVEKARKTLNRNLRFIDFTGNKANYREAAAAFVPGIESVIDQDQLRYDTPPGVSMICIDYAGAAADRHCEMNSLDPSKFMRLLVGKMPLRIKNRLAVKHHCPVWCFHQLNTDANSRQAGIAPKVTDIADARNFLENCTFGFLIGTKTRDDLVVMATRKQRRAKQLDESVLQIEGALARVRSTGNAFRLDRGMIVKASDRNRIALMEDDDDDDDDKETRSSHSEFHTDLSAVGPMPKSGRRSF